MSNEKSSLDKLSVDTVFERISELYGASSDAAIGRKLGGLSNQAVYTYRKRQSIPYGHIIENCPPGDWEYIFTGRRSEPPADGVEAALRTLTAAGFEVTLKAPPAAQPPRGLPEGPKSP